MIQPKYISIFKMALIQGFAFILLLGLQESIWQITFIDCLEIFEEKLYSEGEVAYTDFSECYDKRTGTTIVSWRFENVSRLIPIILLLFTHIILSIMSTIRIGHKWSWAFLSIIFKIGLTTLINYYITITIVIYRITLTLFDNIFLAVYLNMIFLIIGALFLYFGKPVVNFIKGEPISPNDTIDDILDERMV